MGHPTGESETNRVLLELGVMTLEWMWNFGYFIYTMLEHIFKKGPPDENLALHLENQLNKVLIQPYLLARK